MPQKSKSTTGFLSNLRSVSPKDRIKLAAIAAAERLEDRTMLSEIGGNPISWVGGHGNLWNNPANWGRDVVPDSTYDVSIPAGAVVDVDVNESCNSIATTAGSTLNIMDGASFGSQQGTFGGALTSTASSAFNFAVLIISSSGSADLVGSSVGQVSGSGLISNSGSFTLDGSSLNGMQLTSAPAATLIVKGSSSLQSGSTILNQNGGTFSLPDATGISGSGTITNEGLLNINPGSGATAGFTGPTFVDNGGTINLQSGTLSYASNAFFESASFNIASGAVLALSPISSTDYSDYFYFSGTSTGGGAGSVQFNGGQITVGVATGASATSSILNYPAGFFQVSGGSFVTNPQAGSIQQVTNTGTLDFVGSAQHGDLGLFNQGTIDVTGTGDIGVDQSGGLTNDATGIINFEADASFMSLGGNTGFINMGTIEKTGGTGTSSVNFDGTDAGTGTTIDAQTGTIDYPSGFSFSNATFEAAAGAAISLDATTNAFSFSGTFNGSGAGNLVLSAGEVTAGYPGTGATSAIFNFPAGFVQVTGGSFDNNPQGGAVQEITNNGFLDFTGTAAHPDISFINNGTVNVIGSGDLDMGAGSFTNNIAGILNFETDANVTNPGGNVGAFTNDGLIEKTGGNGTTVLGTGTNGINFGNTGGNFDVESGTLSVANGASSFVFTIPNNGIVTAAGTDFDLGGTGNTAGIFLQGNLTVSGGGTVTLSGDSLDGPNTGYNQSTATPSTLNFTANQFTVDGGGFGDNVNLINDGQILVSNGDLGSLLNEGTVTLGSGVVGDSATFINGADGVLLSGTSDGIFRLGNNGNVQNAGVFVMSPGAGNTFDMTGTEIGNTGTLIFGPGTTKLPWISNQYDQYPGLFPSGSSVPAGSTFQLNAGAIVDVDTAPSLSGIAGTVIMNADASFPALDSVNTITGSWSVLSGDTVSLTGGLTNNGTLSVAGSFTVNGDFTQALEMYVTSPPTPTLDFEIAAAPGSAGAPMLSVTGATALAGDLTADYVNGYNGSAGGYTVATFASAATGTFASIAGTAPFFTPSIGASQIILNGTAFTGTGGSTPGGIAIPAGGTGGGGGGTSTGTVDLAISSVTAPATFTPGSSQTITWSVTNSGTGTASGWEDSVFLSTDQTLSSDDVLLGRVKHSATIAAAGTYTGTLMLNMPAVASGNYYVIVVADSGQTLSETNYSNNLAVSAATAETVPALTLAQTTNGNVTASQQQLYSLSLSSGQVVILSAAFATTLEAELYVGLNAVPTSSSYLNAATAPDQTSATLLISATVGGTYYVLVDGRPDVTGSQGFSLNASLLPYGPANISPTAAAAVYQTTLTIAGNGFTPSTSVRLVEQSLIVNATNVTYVNAQTLYATFPLGGVTPGLYGVQTTEPSGTTATLPMTFTVRPFDSSATASAADSIGRVVFQFNVPTYVRAGGTAIATLTYENIGGTEVDAPLFEVEGTNCLFQLPGMRTLTDNTIDIIGTSPYGPAGVLEPGQVSSVQVAFVQGTNAAHVLSKLDAFLIGSSNTIDWDAAKAPLKPDDQSQAAWDTTWTNYEALVGSTVGSYQRELTLAANQLSAQGYRTNDVARYITQILQIAGDFGNINYRDTLTSFGYGQVDPYDSSLTFDSVGDAAVGENNDYTYFLLQPNGSFVNEDAPIDQSMLVHNGDGTYTLTEGNGSKTDFNADGTLNSFYDAKGNQTTVVTTNYSTSVTNADGSVTTTTNAYVSQLTDANGAITKISRNGDGMVTSITDPQNRVESFAYDSDNNLMSVSGPGGTVAYIYADPTSHEVTQINYANGTEALYSYDSFERINSESGAGGADKITMTYDGAGDETVTDALNRSYILNRSADGGIDSVEDPLGNIISQTDNGLSVPSLVTSSDGSTETTTDAAGDVTAVVASGGALVTLAYDTDHHLTSLTDPDNHTTTFTYDANGNLLTSSDPNHATTTYSYTTKGLLASSDSAAGRVVDNTYNTQGQLMGQTFSDGSSASYTYDNHNNLITATNSFGTETFTYDSADRLTKVLYPDGLSLTYSYNANGQLASTVDQSGATQNDLYNSQGQLDEVTNAAGGMIVAYTYDASGEISRTDLGNGTYTLFGYDGAGRENSIINYAANGTIQSSFTYVYDGAGRIISMTTLAGVTTYTYNANGELIAAALPGGTNQTWSYDAAGNRTSSVNSSGKTTYTTNNLNQYTAAGGTSFTYDADGNLASSTTSGITTTYTYDDNERLIGMSTPTSTTTFTYDALGYRVAETVNGVIADMLVNPTSGTVTGQFGASGNVIAEYQYGLGLVGESLGSANTAPDYYQFDLKGNAAALTDPSGAVLNTYAYSPFGQTLATTGTTANAFTFDGRDSVQSIGNGNYLTQTRLYSSTLGRFTQRDPLGFNGGDANLYRYVDNNPVTYVDPSGTIAGFGTSALNESFLRKLFEGTLDAARADVTSVTTAGSQAFESSLAEGETFVSNLASNTGTVFSEYGTQLVDEGVPALFTEVETVVTTGGEVVAVTAETTTAVTVAVPVITLSVVSGFAYAATHPKAVYDRISNLTVYDVQDQGITRQKVIAYLMRTKFGQLLASSGTDIAALPLDQLEDYLMEANQVGLGSTESRGADDPNAIYGPAGYGSAGFIPAGGMLPYQISFVNDATASAPAAVVTITETLDSNLDWSTFQLGDIGYGSTTIAVPTGLQNYTTTMTLTSSLTLDIAANFDAATGVVTWTFTTIDNATGDVPSDPSLGFLPPDVTPPQGEGFVDYTVSPLASLATGATIQAQASIVFDNNAAIATANIVNTVDAVAPTSTIAALAATQSGTYFTLTWSGSDDTGGSGIVGYTIYVSQDGGAYTPWLAGTTATSAVYLATPGHTYSFYSQAIDGAGNEQTTGIGVAQATTTVPAIMRTLTFSAGKPARFTDAAGVAVTISLSGPGTGTLSFISNSNADPVSLVLNSTTARSSVSVHVARGAFVLGTVLVNGSLNSFNALRTSFVGNFTVTGTLANLVLGDETIIGSTLSIAGAAVPTAIRMGAVSDLALTDAAAIRSLTVTSWTDGPRATDSVTAPSIGTISVTGNFDPTLILTGAALDLRSLSVRGTLSGQWTLTGSVGQITAGATAATWTPTIGGAISKLTLRGAMAGTLTAVSLGSAHAGSLNGATITLSSTATGKAFALNSLIVTGTVLNSDIITQGSIRTVTAGGFSGSELFAGVVSGQSTLPTGSSAFAASATITAVRSSGKSAFADTLIAAAAIGSVALVNATTDNGGTIFGVATESLKTFSLSQPKQKAFTWNSKKAVSLLATLPDDLRVSVL